MKLVKWIGIFLLMLTVSVSASAKEYVTLDSGSTGDDVKELQQALIDQGFLKSKANGKYEKKTIAAVQAYQESVGLEATGIADEATQRLLFDDEDVSGIEVKLTGDSESEYIRLKGVLVDESYKEVYDSTDSKALIYVLYTVFTNGKNIHDAGYKYDTLEFEGSNSYTSAFHKYECFYLLNYKTTPYVTFINIGESRDFAVTFSVPKAELTPGRKVTFTADGDEAIEVPLTFYTDDIVYCKDPKMVAKIMDPEGYERQMENLKEVDKKTAQSVQKQLKGTWTGETSSLIGTNYVNTKHSLTFKGDRFTHTVNGSESTGTIKVTKRYILLIDDDPNAHYPIRYMPYQMNGKKVETVNLDIPYGNEVDH